MQEETRLPDELCRKLSLAGTLLMLYFFIQDDVMDETAPTGSKTKLAFANLLYIESLQLLQQLFPVDSSFWQYFKQYIEDWTAGVVLEGDVDFYHHNLIQVGLKASPVKLMSTGSLMLAGQSERISDYEHLIGHILVLLQMSDDLMDWRADLQDGNYNCLLAAVKLALGKQQITAQEAGTAIAVRGIAGSYAKKAQEINFDLNGKPSPSHLRAFQHSLCEVMTAFALKTEEHKRSLVLGGLYHQLSKSREK
ncbi:class 1 isoprenoid biosynthesis enzyme [Paenibacillus protaetiae]|uniref:Class 1 isoprenoid biosynthesis enzyme n=1 Tax=Paenibacillus protaetiae TaxID=2509456 RepID=A0A4P6FBV7_9BACL|nr:class 1 isoprenoid biosynthesis enzyme [Paenibacillus protaetiae]QAY68038.1 class 1 isoprenoid biosynthesis enzyme [Paenibacillus protaetiae]